MAKRAVVIGLAHFGFCLAQEARRMGFDVLGIDKSEQVVRDLEGQLTTVVQGDAKSERLLRELGIGDYDLAIVAVRLDIEASILITLLVKEMGVRQVVAMCTSPLHMRALKRSGADTVIKLGEDASDAACTAMLRKALE
ncbi:MAG: TrkA family potassium uptake protein [Chloroflexi bacterium]|nr:TrkA family potassium uptake protein [Chloroflexota bacterium]